MKGYNPEQYWDGRFKKGFNLEAVGFDSFGRSFNRQQYRMKRKVLERVIRKYGLSGKRVLDIGCGTGFYVDIWQAIEVEELVGIDISSLGIKKLAKKYPPYKFYKADISSPALVGSKFNVITAFDVLFHIVDDKKFEQAIKNIRRYCTDDALILITDIFLHKEPYILNHQKSRTLSTYEEVLKRNGIEVIERIPVHYLLNAPLDISSGLLRGLILTLWWQMFVLAIERTTHLFGYVFSWVDAVLSKWVKESISTELMICRPK